MAWLHLNWFPVGLPMLPLTGLALAGLIVTGPGCWPAAAVGLVAGVWLRQPAMAPVQAITTVTATTIAAAAGAWVIRRQRFAVGSQMPLPQIAVLSALCLMTLVFHQLLRACLLYFAGQPPLSALDLAGNMLRTALGILLWVSLAVAWLLQPMKWPRWHTVLHFLAVMAAVTASAALVFLNPLHDPFLWTIAPSLIWAALAFKSRGTTVALMVVAFFTLYGTSRGLGPFHNQVWLRDWMAQVFLIVQSATMLLLARLADRSKLAAELGKTARTLRAREAQLNLFISDAPAAIAIFDRKMRYLAYLRRYLADNELAPDTILMGRSHYEIFPDIPVEWHDMHQRALAGEELSGEEDALRSPSGRINYVRWKLKPWRGHNGAISGTMIFREVVTDAVEARERLRAAQVQLMRVSRLSAMGAMASTLAHELNQPLTAISNFCSAARHLVRSGVLNAEKLADLMDRSAQQALRAGEIIRKMRDFTVSGDLDLNAEPLDDIIAAACDALRARLAHAEVRIDRVQMHGTLLVMADRIQLEQVIGNLLLNAAEATEGQSVRKIAITTMREGGKVAISVHDNGPGIGQEVAATLFEPFCTTKEHGTGLGLPICRTIIEAHGGKIGIDMTNAKGALFRLTLLSADAAEKARCLGDEPAALTIPAARHA